MSRCIDADKLEKAIRKRVYAVEVEDILAEILDTPHIDIVRCKECKWWNNNACYAHGEVDWIAMTEDDYCSMAERKEQTEREGE